MAIQMTKDLPELRVLTAFNNNIIKFNSNTANFEPINAIIVSNSIAGMNVLLYAHPNGEFYFNFLQYVKNLINTKNWKPTLNFDLSGLTEFEQCVNGSEDNSYYLELVYTITISGKVNGVLTEETITKTNHFILGVEQKNDLIANEFVLGNRYNILSPTYDNGKYYLKYWHGYPFRFSTMVGLTASYGNENVNGNANGNPVTLGFNNYYRVNDNYISDGLNCRNLFNLTGGNEVLNFTVNLNLLIEKVYGACGKYFMFINKYGKWNFWLFENGHFLNRSTKLVGKINQDFTDVRDSLSPVMSLGKTGDSTVRVQGQRLTEREKVIVEQIIDSPKIYYFIGKPGQVSTDADWIEVILRTGAFVTETPKKKIYQYNMEFDLPDRNTQSV